MEDEEDEEDAKDGDGDDDENDRKMIGGGGEGGWRGGVPFSWSFRDKGSSPPLCFAK